MKIITRNWARLLAGTLALVGTLPPLTAAESRTPSLAFQVNRSGPL